MPQNDGRDRPGSQREGEAPPGQREGQPGVAPTQDHEGRDHPPQAESPHHRGGGQDAGDQARLSDPDLHRHLGQSHHVQAHQARRSHADEQRRGQPCRRQGMADAAHEQRGRHHQVEHGAHAQEGPRQGHQVGGDTRVPGDDRQKGKRDDDRDDGRDEPRTGHLHERRVLRGEHLGEELPPDQQGEQGSHDSEHGDRRQDDRLREEARAHPPDRHREGEQPAGSSGGHPSLDRMTQVGSGLGPEPHPAHGRRSEDERAQDQSNHQDRPGRHLGRGCE